MLSYRIIYFEIDRILVGQVVVQCPVLNIRMVRCWGKGGTTRNPIRIVNLFKEYTHNPYMGSDDYGGVPTPYVLFLHVICILLEPKLCRNRSTMLIHGVLWLVRKHIF